jgi:phosphoglucomutase
MALSPLAGKPAPYALLSNIPRLVSHYYAHIPDPANPLERVAFGTSGHRGTSSNRTFTESHILAITQAVVEYRASVGITGPLFIGMDSHALSESAWCSALEVLGAAGVLVRYEKGRGLTPTPLISHAILAYNRAGNPDQANVDQADGIVITPSHNPPEDGGFKYNPPSGGPAEGNVTKWIENRANALLEAKMVGVNKIPLEAALAHPNVQEYDFVTPYVADLVNVVDIAAIKASNLKIGIDPLGGSSLPVWEAIREHYGLNLTIVNTKIDPTFGFMTVDKDGKIRMDCSSPYAMASLLALKDDFDIAIGNDPDADRHGIVTPDGLMNPNHFLAVCIEYLFTHRPQWGANLGVGKTLVSSSIINAVAAGLGRKLVEVPVGFKYFVPGLLEGFLGFGGEESAGAAFQRFDGTTWTTDKDGPLLGLLAMEILAVTGKSPSQHYRQLEAQYGVSSYSRRDAPANPQQKAVLSNLSPELVSASSLASEPILAKLTRAPGNDEAIGGLKVVTEHAWFAARPSGTENVYKIYAESFLGADHLETVMQEAQQVVEAAFKAAGL